MLHCRSRNSEQEDFLSGKVLFGSQVARLYILSRTSRESLNALRRIVRPFSKWSLTKAMLRDLMVMSPAVFLRPQICYHRKVLEGSTFDSLKPAAILL